MAIAPESDQRRPRADARRNRERLLQAAKEAYGELGPEVGVAEIARRAGVGQATLFRHFESKEELLLAVLEREFGEIGRIVRECLAEPDPWTGFELLMTDTGRIYANSRGFFEAAKTILPDNSERFEGMGERLMAGVDAIVRRAQRAGALRDDIVVQDLGPLMTAAAQAVQVHNFPERPELWRRYLGVLLDGLRPAAATPLPEPPPSLEDIERAKRRC